MMRSRHPLHRQANDIQILAIILRNPLAVKGTGENVSLQA
jgi:hypothetical protein